MIKCKGVDIFICSKCKRYDPKVTECLYTLVKELVDDTDCRFFKSKKLLGWASTSLREDY